VKALVKHDRGAPVAHLLDVPHLTYLLTLQFICLTYDLQGYIL